MSSSFADRLCEAIRKKGTQAMLGIDPSWSDLPPAVVTAQQNDSMEDIGGLDPGIFDTLSSDSMFESGQSNRPDARSSLAYQSFLEPLIEMAAERVAVVKFQLAFFEAAGVAGLTVLQHLAEAASEAGLLVIFDGKRSDIGNTAAAYADAYLGESRRWQSDALTVSPYLGEEGLTPFVDAADKGDTGIFVLVRTSNLGAGTLQDALIDGRPVYSIVADWVREAADRTKGNSKYSPIGAVVGATVPQQLADLRKQLPNSILLIPGYGAQGGTAKDCAAAFDENGMGAVVNNSRGILYAWKKPEYAKRHWLDASRKALERMIEEFKTVAPVR
jgi:orotidine-5'-phosphate decarboxylase